MLLRCGLLIIALLITDKALALDCGAANKPCKITDGEYNIVVPPKWQGGPAVIYLHGFGGSGAKVVRNKGFVNGFLDRGYALIAPTALPWFENKPTDWAVRDGWLNFPRNDVWFLSAVLADAVTRANIDPDQVLLAGTSRGGSMVWEMACLAPDFARAYAPAAGGFWLPMTEDCLGPVDLLHTHGFADKVVPLEGRTIESQQFGKFTQADIWAGLRLWRRENGCVDAAAGHEIADGQWRKIWNCEAGSLALILHKGGHGRPKGWTISVLDWFEGLDK
ncbi:MAG: polyhydroxybutyrate depolymerase [Rhizobiaceae bacterium]|nr:polyhydroxybutyrate depolymerase [Rhizobiaceae bacterium]